MLLSTNANDAFTSHGENNIDASFTHSDAPGHIAQVTLPVGVPVWICRQHWFSHIKNILF